MTSLTSINASPLALEFQVPNLIIGAGAAGCYVAMQLYERQQSFLMIEKSNKPYSKLETAKTENGMLEMGASIFHTHQTNLIRLLAFFSLSSYIVKLPASQRRYVYFDEPSENVARQLTKIKKKLQKVCKQLDGAELLYTLDDLCLSQLTEDEYILFTTCTDAWYEYKDMNAISFFDSEDKEGSICVLKGGLKELMKRAWIFFHEYLLSDCEVKSITQIEAMTLRVDCKTNFGEVSLITPNLYMCTSIESWSYIRWQPKYLLQTVKDILSLVDVVSCMRFYVLFHDNVLANKVQNHTIGQIIGRWWIKMNAKTLMLYCDGVAADFLESLSDEIILQRVIEDLRVVYGLNLARKDIKSYIRGYWKTGIDILKPAYYLNTNLVYRLPFVTTSITTPEDQGWINGHLVNI